MTRRVALVAPAPVPTVYGGAERAIDGLHAAIARAGHEVETVRIPVDESHLPGIVTGYRAFWDLDVSRFDQVVTAKYPAWMVRHPDHTVLMFHPLRGLYDHYGETGQPWPPEPTTPPTAELVAVLREPPEPDRVPALFARFAEIVDVLGPDHPDLAFPGPLARLVVWWLDTVALRASRRHLALSRTVASRPGYLPDGIVPRVLRLPSTDLAPRATVPDGAKADPPLLFTASRLDGGKRLDLLIDAMAHVPGSTRLHIAGTGPEEDRLRRKAAFDPRIRLLGFVPDDELRAGYAAATAVPFVPRDEDLGLITLEAFAQGTPVVTCRDSGGPTELVRDGVDGRVVEPDPASLGRALAELVADDGGAAAMGRSGRERGSLVTWPVAVDVLLESSPPPARPDPPSRPRIGRPRGGRPRVVVATTFPLDGRVGGGQLRARHLYGGLTPDHDVTVVALGLDGDRPGTTVLAPGMTQTTVVRSDAQQAGADRMGEEVGVPVTDILAGTDAPPAYLDALREAATGAAAVVLAEPYLHPALAHAGLDLPVVYDAYNVEAALKAAILPATPRGRALLRLVEAIEGDAVRAAAHVVAVSEADAAELARRYGRSSSAFTVVPNGTVVPDEVPSPAVRRARSERWRSWLPPGGVPPTHLAVFLGSWHPPNIDAAELLLDVAGQRPDVHFLAVGHHGLAFEDRPRPPNVCFTLEVSDRARRSLLGTADLALNPMRIGSGTNLKLLELLAWQVPVVSTPFGTRGIDVDDAEHLWSAEPDALADAVTAVLASPAEAAARAAAGRRVAERHGWPVLSRDLAAVLDRVVGARR